MKGRPPRYHQIAQSLRERMVSGELAPGARLDNQRRLAQDFGVTLMTLRHALEVLERDGLIAPPKRDRRGWRSGTPCPMPSGPSPMPLR